MNSAGNTCMGMLRSGLWFGVLAVLLGANGAQGRPLVGILVSSNAAPYSAVEQAVTAHLATKDVQTRVVVSTDAAALAAAVEGFRKDQAVLIVTLGRMATQTASKTAAALPVVAAMVAGRDIRKDPNISGVTLDIPVEGQLEFLRKVAPNRRRVGVLWGAPYNKEPITAARAVAARLGLDLHVRKIEHARDLPTALASLNNSMDMLWGLADSRVLNAKTAKHLLVFVHRNKIPMVGPSRNWARAGTIAAFSHNYKDIGTQCGLMAMRVIGGTKAGLIPVESPRSVAYAINERSAKHMKIAWKDTFVSGAAEVFGR